MYVGVELTSPDFLTDMVFVFRFLLQMCCHFADNYLSRAENAFNLMSLLIRLYATSGYVYVCALELYVSHCLEKFILG